MTPVERIFAALRRSLVVIIVIVLVGVATPLVIDQIEGPAYTATGDVLVRTRDIAALALGQQNPPIEDPARQLASVTLVAQSEQFLTTLAVRLGRPASDWQSVRRQLSVAPSTNADSLAFTAQRASSAAAIQEATAAVEQFVTYYPSVALPSAVAGSLTGFGNLAVQEALSRLQVLEALAPPVSVYDRPLAAKRVRPARVRDLAIGLVAGLIAAFIVVGVREALDDKIRDGRELAEMFEVPGLGDPLGHDLDRLRTIIADFRNPAGKAVVAILSPTERDGRSQLARRLADALNQAGEPTAVLDLSGAARRTIGPEPDPLVVGADSATTDASSTSRPDGASTSAVTGPVASTTSSPGPATTSDLAEQISSLTKDQDTVLLSLPAVLDSGASRRAAPLTDAAFLVIRLGVSSHRELEIVRHQLEHWGDRLAAVLLSDVR